MITHMQLHSVDALIQRLNEGELIAYPTEAVFGLGCDPDNEQAVLHLCALKQRPIEKGLILVASHFELLTPYVDISLLTQQQLEKIHASWPGPVTWVMPTKKDIPYYLKGQFDTLAVRVSAHPIVRALSLAFNRPLVSTSANVTSQPPAKTAEEVFIQFADKVFISEGKIGDLDKPTLIKEALTGKVLRY
ncbi:Sua5/YciO/YrdC/YwlC family protein [Thorsellia kenyensis]|uniref:Threonylcarbamoyl-AMP synthase n=1 Tax=Thorsellia kenyensis TaxID=1549888 RepID=A0ABV6CAS2_9GAMM